MSTTAQTAPLPQLRRVWPVFWITGATVGILDILYAFLFYAMYDTTPRGILQGIASGILGPRAFIGGITTALLGLALHFFIAFSVVGFYFLVARRFLGLTRHALLSGVVYGAGVFVVMHYVVIPLSALGESHLPLIAALCEFVEHMVFVGLPAAFAARSVFSSEDPSR